MPFYTLTKGFLGLIVNGENIDVKKGERVELSEEEARKYKYLKLVPGARNKSELKSEVKNLEAGLLSQTPTLRVSDEEEDESGDENEVFQDEEFVDDGMEDEESTNPLDLSATANMKSADVVEMVKEINSKSDLEKLRQIEEENQNRIGVLSAIEKREKQL